MSDVEAMGLVGCTGDGVGAVSACMCMRGQWQGCGHHCPAMIRVKKKKRKKRKTHLVGFASRASGSRGGGTQSMIGKHGGMVCMP